ncbi:MAG TPA: hypothetical protein VG759_12285 [Candidatus Angelobacter sp.]|jgi:hypothetical protein|nr:hypothetical protein [Candidatus Angelobacter sp.]
MNLFVLKGMYCDDGSEFDFDPGEWTSVGDAQKCKVCGKFIGMLPLVPPIRGKIEASKSIFDLSGTSGGDILLSERCLGAFKEHGIQGLTGIHSIELLGINAPFKKESVGTFYLAGVEWGAELDRIRSGLKTTGEQVCSDCGYGGLIEGYDRVAILEESWTGKDLFSIKGLPGVVLTTERVRSLCRTFPLAVCGFVPAEKFRAPNLSNTLRTDTND